MPTNLFVEWGTLLAGIALLTISEVFQPYHGIAAALLLIAFTIRAVRNRRILPRTGLEIPALLFLLSAAIATWVSFDRPTAFLQFLRLFSAAVLFAALADSRYVNTLPADRSAHAGNRTNNNLPVQDTPDDRVARLVASGLILAAAFLAVYWPVQNTFAQQPAKFGLAQPLNRLGLFIDRLPFSIPGPQIHPNVAAGTLALALPIALFLIWEYWRLSKITGSPKSQALHRLATLLLGVAALLIWTALLLTSSRGAWLGLAAAALLVFLAAIQRRWFSKPTQKIGFWGIILLGVAAILAMGIYLGQSAETFALLGKIPDPTGSLQDRPRVWVQAMPLLRDYFFTGSGLMSFYWQYPVYGTLGHVGIFAHVHNFLLEIWIEQGILGLFSALWMAIVIAVWGWRSLDQANDRLDQTLLGWAGLTSLLVVAVHGIVDVVFYVERTLPLLGLITGLAALSTPFLPVTSIEKSHATPPVITSQIGRLFRQAWPLLVLIGLLIAGMLLYHRPLISMAYANLGAVRQSAVELPQYSRSVFGQQTLDQIRLRSDLSQAQAAFRTALQWDANNRTALHRTASIALARRDFPQALAIMQQAWQAGHRDDNTRLLYADALVADEQIDQAAALLEGISSAEDRLLYQAWYRYTLQNDIIRAIAAWKTVLRIHPGSQPALQGLEDAQQRTK